MKDEEMVKLITDLQNKIWESTERNKDKPHYLVFPDSVARNMMKHSKKWFLGIEKNVVMNYIRRRYPVVYRRKKNEQKCE